MMMMKFVRENPAVRTLPRWLAVCTVTAVFILNVITFYAWGKRTVELELFVSMLWLSLCSYLIFGEVSTRCSPFDMALPVSTRRLWLSHVVAVSLAGVAILTATAGISAGGIWLLWKLTGKWLVQIEGIQGVLGLGAQMGAGLILAVVLLEESAPRLNKTPRTKGSVLLSIIVVAAVLLLMLFLMRISPLAALAPAAAAVAIGAVKYRTVPVAFSLVPDRAEETDGTEGAAEVLRTNASEEVGGESAALSGAGRSRTRLGFQWFLFSTVSRCSTLGLKKKLTPWVTTPFFIFFGGLLSGIDEYWLSESLRYAYVPMAAYVLISFTGMPMGNLGRIDSLPIPRRFLLAALVVPSFLALSLGYVAGRVGFAALQSGAAEPKELIEFFEVKDKDFYAIHVPIGFCEIAWGSEPFDATSPWGETQKVWRTPLYRGSSIKLYLPTASGPESTLEFAALQISRATKAVYGEAVPPDEIEERYLEVRGDGRVVPKGEGLTIQADYPHLKRRGDGAVFPVIMLQVVLFWLVVVSIYLRAFRAGVSKRARSWALWGVMLGTLAVWIGHMVAAMTHFMEPHVLAGFFDILIRRSSTAFPGSAVAVWIVCAALGWGAYRIVAWQYERAEMPYEKEAPTS